MFASSAAKMHYVDFGHVPPQQSRMHDRLENWARSCHGRTGSGAAPIFRQAQTPNHWDYGRDVRVPVDQHDASRIARFVAFLPEPHRLSLQWFYVQRTSVMAARRALACTAHALAQYVIDGRAMLINRGA